jgi:type III restriction enzyme
MNHHVNAISNRLSLRPPQRDSLEILARLCEILPLEKDCDVKAALEVVRSEFPSVADFERNFPSMCFALATGVGKTRLMGAFISYLFLSEGMRHFFVLAPNLTIYNKLIADFTPNTPKYVFRGIGEFAQNAPEIITGDTYEDGRGIRKGSLLDTSQIHINIFNISKINSEIRGDKAPRIKRLSEYIGESYFEYLSKLDDLVLIMDEAHRYRASAGINAINELNPVMGLELTATPQVERGGRTEPFKNVIYSYPLSSAMNDGFVKEPAVATRENFDPRHYDQDGLERLKLEDGIRIHENTKVELEVYARENDRQLVKPFALVVAQTTEHAEAIVKLIEDEAFFGGNYKGKVITVHSNQRGEEKDETVQQLLSVENPANPVEIVVHVNMLKEGWDVTNLYTIIPLRAANSKTLVEQSIGRGLRLPYGKRTGNPNVDRLTIVSHDKFQEIIDEANRPDSIIRTGIIIGRDIPEARMAVIRVESRITDVITGTGLGAGVQPVFKTPEEQTVARTAIQVIGEHPRLTAADLAKPETITRLAAEVSEKLAPVQLEFEQVKEKVDIEAIIVKAIALKNELTIDIPRIIITPKGDVKCGYRDFALDTGGINLQPVAHEILIQHLQNHERYRLMGAETGEREERLEDYLVRGLIDFDDISYDDHSPLLYKLAGQVVARLRSYLPNEDAIRNVLQYHQQPLASLIHLQMQPHFYETATGYDVTVSRGYDTLKPATYSGEKDQEVRNFRTPVDDRQNIKSMLFGGFSKSLYQTVKFDSDPERRFAVMLENEQDVLKWIKPPKGSFKIHYHHEDNYEPDFVVETRTTKYLCEPKRASEMQDEDVQLKAVAAVEWCRHATDHEKATGGKPWKYLLIPHDAISENKTLLGFERTYGV